MRNFWFWLLLMFCGGGATAASLFPQSFSPHYLPRQTAVSLGANLFGVITTSPATANTGTLVLRLSNQARFVTATVDSGDACGPPSFGDSSLIFHCANTLGKGVRVLLSDLTVDTSRSSVDQDLTLILSEESTYPDLGPQQSLLLAKIREPNFSVDVTVAHLFPGVVTLPQMVLTSDVLSTFLDAPGSTSEIVLQLPPGMTWLAVPKISTDGMSAAVAARTQGTMLLLDLPEHSGGTGKLLIGPSQVQVDPSLAGENLQANIWASLNRPTIIAQQTVQIGRVAPLKLEFVDGKNDGTADFNTLFAGRLYPAGFLGLERDQLRLTLLQPNGLPAGTEIALQLANGRFGIGQGVRVAAANDWVVASRPLTAAAEKVVLTVHNSGRGELLLDFDQPLDLTFAHPGDVSVNLQVNGVDYVPGVKLAQAIQSSNSYFTGDSVIGGIIPGAAVASLVADVVIKESLPGAWRPGNIGVALPIGVAFDPTAVPQVTVRQGDVVRTDVVTPPSPRHFVRGLGKTLPNIFNLALLTPSLQTPYVITVSGLKVRMASSSPLYNPLNVNVFGNQEALDADKTTDIDQIFPSAFGAQVFGQAVQVAGSGNFVPCPPTSAPPAVQATTISTDLAVSYGAGRAGSMFVLASLGQQGEYCLGSPSGEMAQAVWHRFDGSSPSCLPYLTGTLRLKCGLPLLNQVDLTAYRGARLYAGYGVGGVLAPPGHDFDQMLTTGNYWTVYTVP